MLGLYWKYFTNMRALRCFFWPQLLRQRGWQHIVAIMLLRSVVYFISPASARILILFLWVLFYSLINFSSCVLQTWSLTVVVLSKKYKQIPHMITTNLLVAQVSSKENAVVWGLGFKFLQFWKFDFYSKIFIANCGGQVNLICDLYKQFQCCEIQPWGKW